MLTVAVISQKGGAGKTTIAVGLAVAHDRGDGVAVVVDLDPQGSASVWSDLREADRPVVVSAHSPRVGRVLDAARARGVSLAIIDTAPHASDAALAAARAADVVLIPCRASVADLHAIGASHRGATTAASYRVQASCAIAAATWWTGGPNAPEYDRFWTWTCRHASREPRGCFCFASGRRRLPPKRGEPSTLGAKRATRVRPN